MDLHRLVLLPNGRAHEQSWAEVPPAGHADVKALGVEPAAAEISMLPQNYLKLEGKAAQQMVKLMDVLDDHDDVRQVWSNFDIEEKDIEASLA